MPYNLPGDELDYIEKNENLRLWIISKPMA